MHVIGNVSTNGGSGTDGPMSLTAADGLTLSSGGQIHGRGVINTPNDPLKPLVNSGHIAASSSSQPITLPGYVKGAGSFDNVVLTGTFAPSTASISVGSATYAGLLNIELGGLTAGSDYAQLNHFLGTAEAHLGGTLNVSLINGFMPTAGNQFAIITATGGVFDTFSNTLLPTLPNGLSWNVDYGANSVLLAVSQTAVPEPSAIVVAIVVALTAARFAKKLGQILNGGVGLQ
jgi:hypothetical protein